MLRHKSGQKCQCLLIAVAVMGLASSSQAQDLSTYDPNNYSGGYAEGAYAPIGAEQLYPYDSQDQWQHGYIQYMPFYGAYKHFQPYNYKQVAPQAQAASGWGMSPRMPYSQQYWHRYHEHARMSHPTSDAHRLSMEPAEPARGVRPQGQVPTEQRQLPQPSPTYSPRQFQPAAPVPGVDPGEDSVQWPNRSGDQFSGISYEYAPQGAVFEQPQMRNYDSAAPVSSQPPILRVP